MRFCILDQSLFLALNKEDIFMLSQGASCSTISPNDYVYYIGVLRPNEQTVFIPEDFKHTDGERLRDVDVMVSITPNELADLLKGGIISVDGDRDKRIHITFEEYLDAYVEKNDIPIKQVISGVSSNRLN